MPLSLSIYSLPPACPGSLSSSEPIPQQLHSEQVPLVHQAATEPQQRLELVGADSQGVVWRVQRVPSAFIVDTSVVIATLSAAVG